MRLAQDLVDELGVDAGDQRVSIPYSTRDMAKTLHRSAGTVAAQLRQLDELGIRVASKPVTVIDVSRLNHALGITTPQPATVTTALLLSRVLDIVERNPETAAAMSVFADAIARTHTAPALRESSNVETPALRDESPIPRDASRTRAVLPRKVRKQDLPPVVVSRTIAEVAALTAPIEAQAQRLSLPATNHGQGLVDALASYTDEQVTAAVQRLTRELSAGDSKIRNPIAVLIARAGRSPEFFAPLPTGRSTTESTVKIDELVTVCRSILAETDNRDDVHRFLTGRRYESAVITEVLAALDNLTAEVAA